MCSFSCHGGDGKKRLKTYQRTFLLYGMSVGTVELCPPTDFNFTTTTTNFSAGSMNMGSASRARRVTAAVVDRLTDRQGFKFPASSALLAGQCVI